MFFTVSLKIQTYAHKRLAAERHLADGEFLYVAGNGQDFLNLWGKSRISAVCKKYGQNIEYEQGETKNIVSK